MSTMSASPVKSVMPPPPGVSTPTKVIPSSPTASTNAPGSLQNPMPTSPPKSSSSAIPSNPTLATSLSATQLNSTISLAKQPIPSQNMNHSANSQMPLSLITTEHKATNSSVSVQSVSATVQSTSTNRTPEKQVSQQDSFVKPTSNGVEEQTNVAHQPVSLTITPVSVTQQPPVVSSDTSSSDQNVSCPSDLTFSHSTSASISLTPVNPVKLDNIQPSQQTTKQDNTSLNQQGTRTLPLPLTTSPSSSHKPVLQSSSSGNVRPANEKGASESAVASCPNTGPLHRPETAVVSRSPVTPIKADSVVNNKLEQPISSGSEKSALSSTSAAVATASHSPIRQEKPDKVSSSAKVIESLENVDLPTPSTANNADAGSQQAVSSADANRNTTSVADQTGSKAEPNDPAVSRPQPSLVYSTPASSKSEMKVATIPRGSKRKRDSKNVTLSQPSLTSSHQPSSESSKEDALDDRKSKRVRLPTQPYQSPLPEFSLIAKMNKTTPSKTTDDKLIVFYKNEFLAVRNAEGGFYICQAMQNIYKSSPKIRIRWLSQEASTEVYSPDFYDTTDFDCILTNLNLEKVEREKFRLPAVELHRTESILKRALDVEKGVSEKPSVTEEHPDGLDLSLFRDESQLKKTPKKLGNTTTSKVNTKKSSRSSRSGSNKESDTAVENAQSDEEKKRKKENSTTISKTNKKNKKLALKKKSQISDKKTVAKLQTNVKTSVPKKKKKKKAAVSTPPVTVEPARSTVKRKRSTSTPPAPASSTKRAKKPDGTATQPEEKSSKTRNMATVQTVSKNRNSSLTNAASVDKTNTDTTGSTSAVTKTSAANGSNAASKDNTNATPVLVTTTKDNRERRSAKSRK